MHTCIHAYMHVHISHNERFLRSCIQITERCTNQDHIHVYITHIHHTYIPSFLERSQQNRDHERQARAVNSIDESNVHQLYVCIYVCMCVCIRMYVYMCLYICVYVCIACKCYPSTVHVYLNLYTVLELHICMYVSTEHIHICIFTYTYSTRTIPAQCKV